MSTVIVTGDSRGLGSVIADKILENTPFSVVGISRSLTDARLNRKDRYGNRYKDVEFDLSNVGSIEHLYSNVLKDEGPIIGLVNNAAFAYDDIVTNASNRILRKMFNINVESHIMLTKYAIRDMILNDVEGSIVFISSVSTSTGYKGLSMYGASKGALESFSLGVAREWGRKGIRSNCIAPGFMDTEMTDELDENTKERIYSRTSLNEETSKNSVSEMVSFLIQEKSKSITGEVIRVDSGTL
ncbi:SDR family oxidoreductase [Salinibacter ruber]|uniref:SDR family oxidoreductase n=1 Tax=Salinibacter ruber TaxID=146919 RepID=UPI002072C4DA|nr:SDR family oxidoreductase [Salinibacter ruber]